MPKYPNAILWVDLETTDLDRRQGLILEVGAILTNTDLEPIKGYETPIQLTADAKDRLRADPFVMNMHLESGLLRACRDSTTSVRDAELAIIEEVLLAADVKPGEVLLAGSGNARFDSDFIERLMPELWGWLAYFQIDVGIMRRMARFAAPDRELFPKVEASFVEGTKAHRAFADVTAHLEEARGQFAALRSIPRG